MTNAARVTGWIRDDPARWELLGHVRELNLPDCWIAAGFVRNAVWSILHGRTAEISGDVDVIWFDRGDTGEARDRALEARLRIMAPRVDWSIKNQARMHIGNGDVAYTSSEDAMRFWPETATAVAVRRTADDACDLIAPLGLEDLLGLKLRPAGLFAHRKRSIFEARVHHKRWLHDFPKLELAS